MTAAAEITDLAESVPAAPDPDRVGAGGTRLRLRALAAMGHSDTRIARALDEPAWLVTKIINRAAMTVTAGLRDSVTALYDAWWDKRPPERTPAERAAAEAARTRARRGRWCAGMGLDDDEVDVPGYEPRCIWRPAMGTGVAEDDPFGRQDGRAEQLSQASA